MVSSNTDYLSLRGGRSSRRGNVVLRLAEGPQEQEALQREIQATDNQIDRLVYDLYGLTEEEIKIVEGKG